MITVITRTVHLQLIAHIAPRVQFCVESNWHAWLIGRHLLDASLFLDRNGARFEKFADKPIFAVNYKCSKAYIKDCIYYVYRNDK